MSQRAYPSSLPRVVPTPVKALGEPEDVFRPSAKVSGSGKLTGSLLALIALGSLGIAGMLFYCAVHPFGVSPPPPSVCWPAGGALCLLACFALYGSNYYFSGKGDPRQAYLSFAECLVEISPKGHRIIPWDQIAAPRSSPALKMFRFSTAGGKDIAFDSSMPRHDDLVSLILDRAGRSAPAKAAGPAKRASTATAQAPAADHAVSSMEDEVRGQPALQKAMGNLIEALIGAAPSYYAMLHLLVEARRTNGKTYILFTHGSPVLLNEYSTLVPDTIAHTAFAVADWCLRQDERFSGFEIVLRKKGADKWNVEFCRLDERHPEWPQYPRYPIRVCGYGLSLAPVPNTVFRWAQNANPFGIVASARPSDSEAPPKQVQILLSDSDHQVALGQGVVKAEDVVQISEGPVNNHWTIETPIFHAVWPVGLDLRYPLASKTRFDLVGRDDSLIFVQGPVAGDAAPEHHGRRRPIGNRPRQDIRWPTLGRTRLRSAGSEMASASLHAQNLPGLLFCADRAIAPGSLRDNISGRRRNGGLAA